MRRRSLLLALAPPSLAALPHVPLAVGEHGAAEQWGPLFGLLERAAGIRWDIRPLPWPRAQAFAERGGGLIFGVSRTPQRERRFAFSRPAVEVMSWALVRQGEAANLQREGFAQRTLCMARGSSYPENFAARGIAVGRWLDSDQGDPATLRMLLAGRCDAAVLTLAGRDAAMVSQRLPVLGLDLKGLEVLPRPLLGSPLHFATGLHSPWRAQLRRIDAALGREQRAIEQLMRAQR